MKKLTLLKPDRKRVYLDNGRGQEVDYLCISPKLSLKALERDVKAGAVQFKECLSFAEKKPTQVVVIETDSEEEGLMAASYLAGIYNWKDGIAEEYLDVDSDGIAYNSNEEAEELSMEDYRNMEELHDYDDEDPENDYNPMGAEWEEDPRYLPIITIGQLTQYSNSSSVFQERNMFLGGGMNEISNKPYWLTATREPVCILVHEANIYGWLGEMDATLTKELHRFQKNRCNHRNLPHTT